jgi:restriction endonuclease S subunit
MPLPLPPIKEQEQIVTRLIGAREAAQSLLENLSIEPIEALPSAVLSKAFAGEL